MKKILPILCILSINFCFSQTLTKKYNSNSKQYEYYDSFRNMIAYERYNSNSQQWEYYEVQSSQPKPYQYRDPAKLDLSPMINAASIKQNQYNNNLINVQNRISQINNDINNLNLSDSQKSEILNLFSESIAKNLNGKSFDYSSSNETNRIIKWLYDTSNKLIKNVTSEINNNAIASSSNTVQNRNESELSSGERIYEKITILSYNNKNNSEVLLQYNDLLTNYSNYEWHKNYKSAIFQNIIQKKIILEQFSDAEKINEEMFKTFPDTKTFYLLNKATIRVKNNQHNEVLHILENVSIQDENDFLRNERNPFYLLSVIDTYYGNFYSYRGLSKIKVGKKTMGCADIQIAIKNVGYDALYYNNQYCKK